MGLYPGQALSASIKVSIVPGTEKTLAYLEDHLEEDGMNTHLVHLASLMSICLVIFNLILYCQFLTKHRSTGLIFWKLQMPFFIWGWARADETRRL